jgi:predicted RNA-binding protein
MEEKNTLMGSRIPTHKSANVTIYFNDEMDEGEVRDFVERILEKYHHPDDVVKNYEYWYDE